MNVRIDNFHGIQPRLHPSLLADGMAVRAHNCRLKNGKLVPLRRPKTVRGASLILENGLGSVGDANTLHLWKWRDANGAPRSSFLAFPGIVDVEQGNIADDERDRLFVAGDTGVSWKDAAGATHENVPAVYFHDRLRNNVYRRTIMKSALSAPKAGADAADPGKTIHYAAFFWSWFGEDGYESPLSPASEILELNDGATVRFEGAAFPADATGVRVYASATGSDAAADGVQFFAERSGDVFTTVRADGFSAVFRVDALGESEPGIEAPPADLFRLKYVPGGFYAGAARSMPHTVLFSDVGVVTSWPAAYRYDVKDNVVALAVTSNTVFALTDGYPWVLSGTAPESMSAAVLAGPAACVSPRGVCVYRNSVYFASNEGLMMIANSADSGTVCANLTEKVFTKEQWQARNPSTCMMGEHDGALFLFFRDARGGIAEEGLTVDLRESADAVTTHGVKVRAACADTATDKLYFVGETKGEA
jgi:hypothetical protein